ncbi:MAG: serine/threonine-protein kinase [Phycisphaerales bacterium]
MNHDSFKHIEALFHELSELDRDLRDARLNALGESDPQKAQSLRLMFNSITEYPSFLDPETIDAITPSSVDIPLDGSVILGGRYKLEERIGIGGSSSIFRAQASDPSRDVAIKMLRIGLDSPQIRERFMLESHALATLTHPHIAHVYQTGIYVCNGNQIPWIAMELVLGSETIIKYVNENKLDQNARIDLFVNVCEAVRAAHQSGVLHLDLNASNILIDPHGYPKIIDFGLFGILNSLSRKEPVHVGTRISMAPEQTVFQSGTFDERTDIYALGLLLTELLTGTQLQLFQGTNTEHALKLIAAGKPRELLSELTQISDRMKSIIDTTLHMNPEERFQSIDQLLQSIQQARKLPQSPPTNRVKYLSQRAGVLIALIVSAVIYHQLQPNSIKQVGNRTNEFAISVPKSSEDVTIPRQLAIDLASQNPRTTQYSNAQTDILAGMGSAVKANTTLSAEDQATFYAKLADQHRIAGQYEDAIQYFLRSAELLQRSNLSIDYNWVMLSLIQTQIFLERIDHAQQTLELLDRGVDLPLLFRVDLSLAETKVYIAMTQNENALRQASYTEMLIDDLKTVDEQLRIERLLDLASTYETITELDSASSILRKAKLLIQELKSSSTAEIALIDLRIGINEAPNAFGELSKIVKQMEQAIIILRESGDDFHAAWGLRQLGNVHLRSEQFQLASMTYERSHVLMVKILGEDHHESIQCRAYTLIAQHAFSDTSESLEAEFKNTLQILSHSLGQNHSMIHSLQNDWDELYVWNSRSP